jgi:hypothetical protein
MSAARILTWNGKDVPEELQELPAGRYTVEPAEPELTLSEEEDEGLREALASLRSGKGRTLEQVRSRVNSILRR